MTYIVADSFNVSGVLAVVICGLIGARILRTHHSSLRRIIGYAVWDVLAILLNCLVFILIGLQVKTIAGEMSTYQIIVYSGYAVLIALTMVIVRLMWVYAKGAIAYVGALHHRDSFYLCPQILKEAAITGWASMRGMVSLAVALSLPFTLPNGMQLEGRNEVVFITFMVISITLLIPGLTLPFLIHWLKLKPYDQENNEQKIRQQLALHADELTISFLESKMINQKEYRFLKSYFRSQHKVLELAHEDEVSNVELARRKVIRSQRSKLMEIWKQHGIDDKLVLHLENELDMLETHIARARLKV